MTSYDDLLKNWKTLFDAKQNVMPLRTGLLGDGKGNVVVGTSMPGWSWIRYDSNPHRVSMVINQYEHWADDTPVVVGKRHPDDADEQVLGINFAHHEYALNEHDMAYMFAPPHGESHLSSHTDPACIDTGNIMDGKVVATVPASMDVYVHAFVYPDDCNATVYAGGTLDLSGYVPGALYVDVHWYVLVYFSLDDNELHALHGDSENVGVVPIIPDTPSNSIPLAVIDISSTTTAITTSIVYQYKILWGDVCGPVGVHTHTDDNSGGSSILGLEELMFECADPLEIQIHAIYPTQIYHALTVSGMYIVGPYDLETIVPDPIYGCGQLLIIRLATTMYGSYSVVVKHGVDNIWLSGKADITLDEPTDHLTLIYNGAYWCDILPTGTGAAGGAPVGAQYVTMALDAALTAERILTAGAHLNLADGGAGGNATLSVITVPDHLHAGAVGDGNEIPVTSLSGHVRGSIIRGEAADWAAYDAKTQRNILEGDGVDIISRVTTDGQTAWQVVRTDANRAIRPRRLGLHAAPPDQDGAIALKETANPTNVAGVGMLYTKDDAGTTRLYLERDDGLVYEVGHVIKDVTKTVKAVGGDFTTIQAAIDWFADRLAVFGDNTIDVDAGTYDEAVDFSSILLAAGATIKLEGDTRALAGLSFVHGCAINQEGQANGGSGTGALANAGAVITVTGTVGNPDFAAAGWVNGDKVLIYTNAGVTTEYTISATLNNTITLTVAAPAVGNDSTVICLLPNRRIERTAAGPCIKVTSVSKIIVSGWYLVSSTGASCYGLWATDGAYAAMDHVAVRVEDYGIYSHADSRADAYPAISCFDSYGLLSVNLSAAALVLYAVACDVVYGYSVMNYSMGYVRYSIAVNCSTDGFYCYMMGLLDGYLCWARQCTTTGYRCLYRGYMYVPTTNAHNNNPGADYNPAVSDVWGNSNASITWS